MTTISPTYSQIRARVATIHQKVSNTRVIGIQAPGRWTGASQPNGDEPLVIYQCDSPLAMRLALREPIDTNATKVLVTNLDAKELSDDILVRLARRKLYQIDSWEIVRSLFQAHAVDPRLTRYGWIADALLDSTPSGGFPPARAGFLDAEIVWSLLLDRVIGLSVDVPDLAALLKWSTSAEAVERFRRSPDVFRAGAIQWLSERLGPVGETVLRCVERLECPDALPLGLAVAVVSHPEAAGRLEKAIGKLEERYFGGTAIDSSVVARWGAVATEVVRLQLKDARLKRQQLHRADKILREIGADAFAYLSDTSPSGFDQRLARFGEVLSSMLQEGTQGDLDEVRKHRELIREHDQTTREDRRLERIDMALRLVRWLRQSVSKSPAPRSLAKAAEHYLRDGGYVDWARLALRGGDPVRQLSEAYAKLFDAVTSLREEQAQQFARLLRDWTAAGSQDDGVIPVERILEQVVAPLAAESPVLVIVVDGMSVAVCRELLADLVRHEWVPLAEPGRTFNRPAIAAIPSVTEMSRTSLLCGQLRQGASADEKAGFAAHPALLSCSRSGYPPILFHKPSLQDSEDRILAPEVRKEIGSTHRRIVGVVINAVDDHLLKGEQLDTRWSRDEIRALPSLLHEARTARRLVVLVSDHGHVLDSRTAYRPHEGGERWRVDVGQPESDELRIEGSRVLAEGRSLTAPWSEQVRYGGKKNGYHGGLSPQEMVVPITVLTSMDSVPEGWTEAGIDTPDWWDEPLEGAVRIEQLEPELRPAKPRPAGMLFDLDRIEEPAQAQPQPETAGQKVPDWISHLLASPVFADQKRLGGRAVPDDGLFGRLLMALDRRGGKLTSAALARALEYPPLRLRGLLAVAQRVLNVDGYPVLNRDEASDTIELNRELLLRQFDLV